MMSNAGLSLAVCCLTAALFSSCNTTSYSLKKPQADQIVVSVDDQRLVIIDDGKPVKSYPVSTSKFGLGSKAGSHRTPLGNMYVYQKIGGGARAGTVFKSRKPTGEVLKPNAPGRDPIVTRILWLEGKERSNSNTKERTIYIHGTPEESTIGRPASYGCIRMKSKDVIDLYDRIGVGTDVYVKRNHLKVREIPDSDRLLLAAAKTREGGLTPTPSPSPPKSKPVPPKVPTPVPDPIPGLAAGTELLAAAEPQRRTVTRSAPVTQKVERRPPAPSSPPSQQSRPARRGAFTRMPDDTVAQRR